MKRQQIWQILAFVISFIGLGIIFSRLDIAATWQALQKLHWWNVLISFAIAVAVQFIAAYRTRILIGNRLSFFTACTSLFIGNYLNALLPLRMGEVARTVLIKRRANIPYSTSAPAIVLSQVMDVLGIGLMAFILLLYLPSQAEIQQWTWISALLVLAGLLPLVLLSRQNIRERLAKHERLAPFLSNIGQGLSSLQNPLRLFWAVLLTSLFWLGTALATWVLLPDLTGEASFLVALAVGVAGGIGRLLPALPGSIGTLDLAVLLSLRLFGIAEDAALLLVLLIRIRYTLSIALLGVIALMLENLSFADTRQLASDNLSSEGLN